jgi:hypothetical protein
LTIACWVNQTQNSENKERRVRRVKRKNTAGTGSVSTRRAKPNLSAPKTLKEKKTILK